jgi:hypothetical protein
MTDLPPSQDLTLIFERDDVRASVSGHCAHRHNDDRGYDRCEACSILRVILVNAITEWKAICDLEEAGRPSVPETGHD